MPAPQINVRLTADGVQDVVNAFRRVQQEAQKTKDQVGLLGEAGQQLKELLPVVSIGLAIGKMVEMGKQAIESAVGIGKLAEKTGTAAGTLSVLVMAAHDVGVSQEELGASLVKLSRAQNQAVQGNAAAQKAFGALGISMDDVKKKSPGDLFVLIAQKLKEMPDGANKTATVLQLLGRAGANLIPVLNEIGESDGFKTAEEKARSLGLYLSDEMIADAKNAEKGMRNLQDIVQGFAMQFVSGMMPDATKAITDFGNTVAGNGTNGFKILGQIAGRTLSVIFDVLRIDGQEIAGFFAIVVDGIVGAFEVGKEAIVGTGKVIGSVWDAASKGPKSMWEALKDSSASAWSGVSNAASDLWTRQKAIWGKVGGDLSSSFGALWSDITSPLGGTVAKAGKTGGGTGGSGQDPEAAARERKEIDALAAYKDAVAQAELQKQKERNSEYEAEDKALYDQGLISLQEYYDARAARIAQEMDAEESILKQKLQAQIEAAAKLLGKPQEYVEKLIEKGPEAIEAAAKGNEAALQMFAKIAATRGQIDTDEIKRQAQLQQNETARAAARKQADAQMYSDRQRLAELEGDTASAQQIALERELHDTDELLRKLGYAEDERKLILNRASANATARNRVGAYGQAGSDEMTSLQMGIADVQDRAAAGAISELQAEVEIRKLEADRLPTLRAIADGMQDAMEQAELQLLPLEKGTDAYNAQLAVVNNLQRQADQYTKQVDKLSESLKYTKSFSVELTNQLTQQGTSAVVGFFDAFESGSKSFTSALEDLGKTFEQIIMHMIDQMLVYYALMALVGWVAPNSNLFKSLSASGPFAGLTGHAAGGYTGNVAPNKVAGYVHGKEFVFNAAATAHWGLPLLQAMNAGTVGSIASGATYSALGSGSTTAASEAGPVVQVNIDTGGQPASKSQRQGPGGTTIIDVVVGQVAANIASGGKVAQSIQSTFGVSRKGAVRG